MSRFAQLIAAAIAALTFTQPAHAADQTSWSPGIASIGISYATPTINLSVRNLSNSPYAKDRELTLVSPPPLFSLDGQVFCKALPGGTTRLVKSQLMFGNPVVNHVQGASLITLGVWEMSAPILYQGNATAANVSFDHHLDLPTTWSGGLITLGFNPVKVVEDRLAQYVANGGTAVDFLRTDDVFEVSIPVNLTGECQNTSQYSVRSYAGFTRRQVTVAIFFHGDSRIQYEPVSSGPGTIQGPSLPGGFYLNAPQTSEPYTFASFPVIELSRSSSRSNDVWAGWVRFSNDLCPRGSTNAVTPDGQCVRVDGCMPVELDSCRAVNGCCEARLSTTTATR